MCDTRFYEQSTGKAVAVKMRQEMKKISMISQEALALKQAHACKVPRVIGYVGTGYAQGMECLLDE